MMDQRLSRAMRGDALTPADPVQRLMQALPQYPMPYGSQMTMPSPGFVPGEPPLMPRFDGAPLVPAPVNADTMRQIEGIMNGTGPGMQMMGARFGFGKGY